MELHMVLLLYAIIPVLLQIYIPCISDFGILVKLVPSIYCLLLLLLRIYCWHRHNRLIAHK